MDRKAAQTLIENTFNYPFDEDRFRYFAINLLTNLDREKDSPYISGKYIKDFFREHVHKYRRIGTYIAPDGDKLDVLVVHLVKPWALERARTMLRNFTAWYLKNQDEKDAALVAYHTDDLDDWRFSFVRMEYLQEITEKGTIKVKEEFTPARRYSYLVGKNEPNHTAQEQMIPILKDDQDNPTLDDIEAAFGVDAVTKQFYKDYRALFEKLTNELNNILEKDNKINKEFEDKSIDTANFSKKLMGQIVFLYFLQKKGWLGVSKDNQGNFKRWGTGPKNFMKRLFNREFSDYKNFFNDILEPLFYNALNNGDRHSDYYEKLDCKIPFLDGGLFEPMNDYDWVETEIRIDNNIFKDILDTFNRYNFTVREDEPLDKEVAVDPEMLGKVFENLLPENLRKGKGTYYTPRNIVHYMCQESLINYLSSECEEFVSKDNIETLICRGEVPLEIEIAKEYGTKSYKHQISQTIRSNAKLIDEKLASIKVCDPAMGSGAFLVGMMNAIVKARQVLNTWLKTPNTIYDYKRNCIQDSLYGVDIDPGAIDIAKLRLWLSLVVDEEDYKTIQPLPNLDYKVMQGNSLVEEFHDISLNVEKRKGQLELGSEIDKLDHLIDDLHQRQHNFFNAIHPSDKQKMKNDVEQAIIDIFRHELNKRKEFNPEKVKKLEEEIQEITHGNKPRNFFPWKLYFADIFREKGGFDVTVANPPYIGQKGNKDIFDVLKKASFWRNFYERKQDIYYYFIAKGLDILKTNGYQTYIIPPYFLTAFAAKNLRNYIKENSTLVQLLDLSETMKVFETSNINSLIAIFKKNLNQRSREIKIMVPKNNIKNDTVQIIDNCDDYPSKLTTLDLTSSEWYVFKDNKTIELELKNTMLLGNIADITPGIQTGCDKVSRIHMEKYNLSGNIKINEGIFILTDEEKNGLNLSEKELEYIKPCFKNSDIYKWGFKRDVKKFIVIINTIENIDGFPEIKKHLLKYKSILDGRYRNFALINADKEGKWWYLYGYRPNTNFDSEKIVNPNRCLENRFAYSNGPFYSVMDIFYINIINYSFDTKYILSILNSSLMFYWLKKNCKKKGKMLELIAAPLKKIPIKVINKAKQKAFVDIVNNILSFTRDDDYQNNNYKKHQVKKFERKINHLVYELYGFTEDEIAIVEENIG